MFRSNNLPFTRHFSGLWGQFCSQQLMLQQPERHGTYAKSRYLMCTSNSLPAICGILGRRTGWHTSHIQQIQVSSKVSSLFFTLWNKCKPPKKEHVKPQLASVKNIDLPAAISYFFFSVPDGREKCERMTQHLPRRSIWEVSLHSWGWSLMFHLQVIKERKKIRKQLHWHVITLFFSLNGHVFG